MNYINLILYILIYICCNILRLSYEIPLEKFQFQCIGHSGIQLCVFPEQYCDNFYSECRPCTQDVCDKRGSKDFPLQCSYNCTGGGSLKGEDDFIHKNANAWFITAVILMSCLVVGAATCPIWKPFVKHKWLDEKIEMIKSQPEEEENSLIPNIKVEVKREDETSLQKIAKDDEVGHATGGYCEEKLKNVNPTEEPADAVNSIATTRAKICDADKSSY